MKQLFALIMIIIGNFLLAQSQTNNPFPNLTKVLIDKNYQVVFGYESKTCRLLNIPSEEDPDFPISSKSVAKFKSENIKDSLHIIYTEGPSADPEFAVFTKTNKEIGRFSCIEFYINSSGTIYTAGHVNNMYNRRRKFQIQKDTITEIRQPYCYCWNKRKYFKEYHFV